MGMWLLMSAYQGLCVRYQNFQVVGVGLELQEEGVGLQVEGVGLGCSTFWEEVEEEGEVGEWAAGERQVQRTKMLFSKILTENRRLRQDKGNNHPVILTTKQWTVTLEAW